MANQTYSVIAIIPAAGAGSRLQSILNQPKQFAPLAGKPILTHTLLQFQRCDSIDGIIIPAASEYIDFIQTGIVHQFGIDKVLDIIPGGDSRQNSVWEGLSRAKQYDPDTVAVHDAARPFISSNIIEHSVEVARHSGGCLTAIRVNDTVKRVENEAVIATLNRAELWAAQTPQTFRYRLLLRAFEKAMAEGFSGTDESMLVERLGETVPVIHGSARNIKITTPEDLKIAQAMIETENKV